MFVSLAIFLIFVLVLNIMIRKNTRAQQKVDEDFWQREQKANFTRRKDISNLNYITIPIEKIPQNLHTDAENTLVKLCDCQMLNLTGMTNTDLKLAYGAANLDFLSACDECFTEFVRTVPVYAKELLDDDQTAPARELLELAVSYQADSSLIYTMLADLYQQNGQNERIQELIDSASELDSFGKNLILEKLKAYRT
jgi:hypothetical protein